MQRESCWRIFAFC